MKLYFIEQIEPTPKLHSRKCKIIAMAIRLLLQYTTVTAGIIMWFLYDYFIGLATLILSFVIMGIVRSKLRNSVIPLKQREYQYNDKGIADWYSAREICFGIDKKEEKV